MAETLTKPQRDLDELLSSVVDQQRTFDQYYGSALNDLRSAFVHQILFASVAGLVVGTLLGTIAGTRRR